MSPWYIPYLSLLGVVVTLSFTVVREAVKDSRQRKSRARTARRILAHHATALAEDAHDFLDIAERSMGADETQIATNFVNATTFDHVYREQIAHRIDDLSDELMTLFRDLDYASNEAAHSVRTLQGWAATMFEPRSMSTVSVRTRPTMTEELARARLRYERLRVAAQATLDRLRVEGAKVPSLPNVTAAA